MNRKQIVLIALSVFVLSVATLFIIKKTTVKQNIIQELRTQQAQADQIIQDSKPTIYNACTEYKQAQLDRDNLETRITTIVNSKYDETYETPKLKTMDVNKFCKDFVNDMSRKFDFTKEQQLQKLLGNDLLGTIGTK